MKIVIVSSSPDGRVVRRFESAARARNVPCEVVDADDMQQLASRDLTDTVVIPRIAPEKNHLAEQLHALEIAGARVINSAESWRISRDKWQTYQAFNTAHVPTPRTQCASEKTRFIAGGELGDKVVFKPLGGTHGDGIVIVEPGDRIPREAGILQEFFDVNGKDVRCIVVGDTVVAAMERQSRSGEFRANLHQGATARAYDPPSDVRSIAVRAAQSLGLVVAGVDLLPTDAGALAIEANPSPGLGIEAFSGVDVAAAIIDATIDDRI